MMSNYALDMKIRQIFTACLLVLSLGILSGFSPILHSHELDLHDEHEDCFSCEWNQVSFDQDPGYSILESSAFEQRYQFKSYNSGYLAFSLPFFGRAPPFLS